MRKLQWLLRRTCIRETTIQGSVKILHLPSMQGGVFGCLKTSKHLLGPLLFFKCSVFIHDHNKIFPFPQEISVPMIATAEYRDVDKEMIDSEVTMAHPLTGTTRRYVLGDRFHNASNPHKSPLCSYRDIKLLLQSNTIKTSSYQECENNRKNLRRLRSSCMQGFATHYFLQLSNGFLPERTNCSRAMESCCKRPQTWSGSVTRCLHAFCYKRFLNEVY